MCLGKYDGSFEKRGKGCYLALNFLGISGLSEGPLRVGGFARNFSRKSLENHRFCCVVFSVVESYKCTPEKFTWNPKMEV